MVDDVVLYEVADQVALVTLNRPERLNAWTPQLQVAYFDRLEQAASDPQVRAIVVTGAGRGFCPGADMDYLQGLHQGDGPDAGQSKPMTYPLSVPKLVLAAINGACAGIGLVQTLMCDLRFAAAGAKFTSAFSRRGLIAEYGSSWMLPRLVGTSRALDLLISSRVFEAEEALRLGVVDRVVAPEALLGAAMDYAQDVAANCSPASVAAIKSQVSRHATADFQTACDETNRLMTLSLQGPDFKEGVNSFVEKRAPDFAPLGQGSRLDRI